MKTTVKILFFLFIVIILTAAYAYPAGLSPQTNPTSFVMSGNADLNGDGRPESITLAPGRSFGEFILSVDGVTTVGMFEFDVTDGFAVVDINASDVYKEIAVHAPGPSDDDEYLVYSFDGASLKEMGRLARWPTFSGNGIVLVDGWMGFWKIRDKYVLDTSTRTLRHVPQDLYAVGVEGHAIKSFPVYRTRSGNEVIANTMPNSNFIILACDTSPTCLNAYGDADDYSCDWYLIKTVTGLVGWVRCETLMDYETVDGLTWAD
ncbi:MAG: hypothetical protein JW885_06960 [Deltaproteobacteria bacterium]|nr:hypothetical protein [Candidatus Zymogenaceae bacterium]